MGIDDTILGLTSDFRYTFKGPIDSNNTDPLSGNYTGYFFYKTNVPRRIYERDLIMDFTPLEGKFQMVGKGSNEFGTFTLMGMYDPVTKDLTCTKEYQSPAVVKKKSVSKAKQSSDVKPKPKPKSKSKSKMGIDSIAVKEESAGDVIRSCLTILQHLMVLLLLFTCYYH